MIKYESTTVNSIVQVDDLAGDVAEKMELSAPMDMPIMIVASDNDSAVDTQGALEWFQQGRFGEHSGRCST